MEEVGICASLLVSWLFTRVGCVTAFFVDIMSTSTCLLERKRKKHAAPQRSIFVRSLVLGVGSPFFSTIALFNNQLFIRVLGGFVARFGCLERMEKEGTPSLVRKTNPSPLEVLVHCNLKLPLGCSNCRPLKYGSYHLAD